MQLGEGKGEHLLSEEYAEPTTVGLDQGEGELKKLQPQDPETQYMTKAEAYSEQKMDPPPTIFYHRTKKFLIMNTSRIGKGEEKRIDKET